MPYAKPLLVFVALVAMAALAVPLRFQSQLPPQPATSDVSSPALVVTQRVVPEATGRGDFVEWQNAGAISESSTAPAMATTVGSAVTGKLESPGRDTADSSSRGLRAGTIRRAAVTPDDRRQIIVKFKPGLTRCVHCMVSGQAASAAPADEASRSVERLLRTNAIVRARRALDSRRGAMDRAVVGPRRNRADRIRRSFPARARRSTSPKSTTDLENIYVMNVASGVDPERALRAFRDDPHVAYAQPNYPMTLEWVPADIYYHSSGSWQQPYDDLWSLNPDKLDMEAAWDVARGEGVTVAIVDTGVDYGHPEIAANIWTNPGEIPNNGADDDGNGFIDDVRGWNFNSNNNDVMDRHGHGTHIAGIIAAAATPDDGTVAEIDSGVVGVAPESRIMIVKGFADNGIGTTDQLADAIVYAVEHGADVINNGWACSGTCPSNPLVEDVVRYAHELGAVVVFAAGNSSQDVELRSPQNMPETMTVAASDQGDQRSSFSNYGVATDVAAPGGGPGVAPPAFLPDRNILSLKAAHTSPLMDANGGLVVAGEFLRQAGTSMSAPFVSGLAALILDAHPEFSNEQVRQAIRHSADDIGAVGFDEQSGYGRINAGRALSSPSPPLAVLITSPAAATVDAIRRLEIGGEVAGTDLSEWTLDAAAQETPDDWSVIASGSRPLPGGRITDWVIRDIPDGNYVLRLRGLTESGEMYEDRQAVALDRVRITAPAPADGAFYAAGETVVIRGTVAPANFERFDLRVENALTHEPVIADAQLAGSGRQSIDNDVIASWYPFDVAGGHYRIDLIVTLTDDSTIEESTIVAIDPLLKPGWPKNIGLLRFGSVALAKTDHLNTVDINGDGADEILIGYGNTVDIVDRNGASLSGWPQAINTTEANALIQRSPAVGNVAGDTGLEIVAGNNFDQIYVWHADGTTASGWPKRVGGGINAVVVDDILGDDYAEIITADWAGRVNVLGAGGTSSPGWPRTLVPQGVRMMLAPAIGDVDGDGRRDIVAMQAYAPSNLWILRRTGETFPGWPLPINGDAPTTDSNRCYPVLADLDDDGDLEIVVGTMDGLVYVLHHDGMVAVGWPQAAGDRPLHTAAVGDLDHDGRLEIVVGTEDNRLFAWHEDGAPVDGWPVVLDGTVHQKYFGFGPPILVDVNGDGDVDVVASSDSFDDRPMVLHAYDVHGAELGGYPRPSVGIGAFSTNTATAGDIDGDGLMELAWVDFWANLYVWDTVASPLVETMPWPMFQHDAAHLALLPRRQSVSLAMDVRPGVCPNVVAPDLLGAVPVSILGDAAISVGRIDVDTVALARADGVGEPVTPRRFGSGGGVTIEDVASGTSGDCHCRESLGDGIDDLTLRFSTNTMFAALQLDQLNAGESVLLTLRGALSDGTPFEAADCVVSGGTFAGGRESIVEWTGPVTNRLECLPPAVYDANTASCELRPSLVAGAMALAPGEQGDVAVLGSINGESTFGVTIMLEIRSRSGNTGSVMFTPVDGPEAPMDIQQVGDPWPGAGLFTAYDTDLAGGTNLNGAVDDDGNHVPTPVTFTGVLSAFPVAASEDAQGVWDVLLQTSLGDSGWEAITTTVVAGTITVAAP